MQLPELAEQGRKYLTEVCNQIKRVFQLCDFPQDADTILLHVKEINAMLDEKVKNSE